MAFMTDKELAEWGREEDAVRKVELAGVDSEVALRRVQDAAKRRRRKAGLSAGQASRAVKLAQMADDVRPEQTL